MKRRERELLAWTRFGNSWNSVSFVFQDLKECIECKKKTLWSWLKKQGPPTWKCLKIGENTLPCAWYQVYWTSYSSEWLHLKILTTGPNAKIISYSKKASQESIIVFHSRGIVSSTDARVPELHTIYSIKHWIWGLLLLAQEIAKTPIEKRIEYVDKD